jgi:hypothetical protein
MIIRTHSAAEPARRGRPSADLPRVGAAQAATILLIGDTPKRKAPAPGTIGARGLVRYKVADDCVTRGFASRKQTSDGAGLMYTLTPLGKRLYKHLKANGAKGRRGRRKKASVH